MTYVYIIQSLKDGSFYTGHTTNLEERIKQHNSGLVEYSSKKMPYTLAWHCVFHLKEKAILFEKYLKSGSGFAFSRKRLI